MYLKINNKLIPIKIANTLKEKLIGLSMQKNIKYGLIIPNCNHIHTFLMTESIDVLFLDENNKVLYKYQNMLPGRTFKVNEDLKKTKVLELPQNSSQSLKIGDILIFESEHII